MVDCSAEALKVRAEDALDELRSGPDDRELEAAKKLVESLRNAREYEVMGRLAVCPVRAKARMGRKSILTEEAKLFVVNALACYETPSAVAEAGSHSAATSTTSRSPAKLSGCTASTR